MDSSSAVAQRQPLGGKLKDTTLISLRNGTDIMLAYRASRFFGIFNLAGKDSGPGDDKDSPPETAYCHAVANHP